jgi:HEAT repeat protein
VGNIQQDPAPPPVEDNSRGKKADPIEADQTRLRTALLPTNTSGLVNFFRLRARREPSRGTLGQLIAALRSPTAAAGRQACAELVAIGTPALPLLRATAHDADARAAELARNCLKAIERDGGSLTIAAIHLLAHRRPPGAAGVLLAYLPHAENEVVLQELQGALTVLTYAEKGVADPAVVKALGDKHPLLRLTALTALAEGDITPHQEQLRKLLLLDPSPSVQMHASLILVRAGDFQAISTLITLLGDLADPEARSTVEDFLIDLAGELGPKVRLGEGKTTPAVARDAWAKWWRDIDGVSLLNELRQRTTSEDDHDKIQDLIRKLGDDNFRVRERAQTELMRLGERALPLLKQAVKTPDLEVRKWSDRCLASIKALQDAFLVKLPVMARLIALRKTPGAAEAILAYLPSLDDEGMIDELQHALDAVAFSDGKPQAVLLKGLSDKSWIRRAAAAQALCAAPNAGYLQTVRGLLKDPESSVRLKTALALVRAGDASAVDVLIALVAELPGKESDEVEDQLRQLAREAEPKDLPDGEANRQKRSKTWAAWWQANKGKVVLRPAPREWFGSSSTSRAILGYTLLVQPKSNTITELGSDGRPRWRMTGLAHPSDAQILSGGQRVLVAEQNRVTERDLRGKILWQKEVLQPLNVQRLRNGNTFIACNHQLLEVDRAGKEVLRVSVQLSDCGTARKLRNGQIVAFNGGQVIQLDKTGRVLKSTLVQCGGCGRNEVTEDGHVLALSPGNGNLIEFDTDGKELHRFDMPGAGNAFRLSNGHTLLIAEEQTNCIELDKNWKAIKQKNLPAPALRLKRR